VLAALFVLLALAFLSTILLAASTLFLAAGTLFHAFFLAAVGVGAVSAVVESASGVGASTLMLMFAALVGLGAGGGVGSLFGSGVVVTSSHTKSKGSGDESS
jgi:hypothetical protein